MKPINFTRLILSVALTGLLATSAIASGDVVYVASGGTGDGSHPSLPLGSLADAQASSAKTIQVVAGDGHCLDGGITLSDNRTLEGKTVISCHGEDCQVVTEGPAICNTTNKGLTGAMNDGNAINVVGDHVTIKNIHISEATRFGVHSLNQNKLTISNSLIRKTSSSDPSQGSDQAEIDQLVANHYLPCPLITTLSPDMSEYYMAVPRTASQLPGDPNATPLGELGCWMWSAAFPGTPAVGGENAPGRAGRYFFSNITTAAIGLLANERKLSAKIRNTVIKDFTSGLIQETSPQAGQYGFAVGAIGILLSTDADADYSVSIKRVNINNSEAPVAGGRSTRDARCTYAAIFTEHHDDSKAVIDMDKGVIGDIGGCDGLDTHFGHLPGVVAGDGKLVRVLDDQDSSGNLQASDTATPDLGPNHLVDVKHKWNSFHIVNAFDDASNNDSGGNPGNQFTDAFEPIIVDGRGASRYNLDIKNSTFSKNAGNAVELRFGGDEIEFITTPVSTNVKASLKNSCFYDNAQADDRYEQVPGCDLTPIGNGLFDSATCLARDQIAGRDFHQIHLFLPPQSDFNYVVNATHNYWGRSSGLLFSQDAEVSDIIAINTDYAFIDAMQSSSYLTANDLLEVFDSRHPRKTDKKCYKIQH
jgi:hypothetical protein